VEVPVMLSVCQVCNGSRGWYNHGQAQAAREPAHHISSP